MVGVSLLPCRHVTLTRHVAPPRVLCYVNKPTGAVCQRLRACHVSDDTCLAARGHPRPVLLERMQRSFHRCLSAVQAHFRHFHRVTQPLVFLASVPASENGWKVSVLLPPHANAAPPPLPPHAVARHARTSRGPQSCRGTCGPGGLHARASTQATRAPSLHGRRVASLWRSRWASRWPPWQLPLRRAPACARGIATTADVSTRLAS